MATSVCVQTPAFACMNLFAAKTRIAGGAAGYFKLRPNRVIELGTRMQI